MPSVVRLDGLLCTRDIDLLRVVRPALDSFAIETQVCREIGSALDEVRSRKLDAVIVDWNDGDNPVRMLRGTRNSSWNCKSTIFAVVGGASEMHSALRAGANFLINKPPDVEGVARCLRAAYGTMLQQRRRAERCPVDIPVVARFSELGKIEARIIDISAGGLALRCTQPVDPELQVSLNFMLPSSSIMLHVAGKVVNSDRKGRAGICFSFISPSEFKLLEAWLTVQFEKLQEAEIPSYTPTTSIH